jgi:hypothetical protein
MNVVSCSVQLYARPTTTPDLQALTRIRKQEEEEDRREEKNRN